MPLRCARCQGPLQPEDAAEVGEEQGTSASLVYVHRDGCEPAAEMPQVLSRLMRKDTPHDRR